MISKQGKALVFYAFFTKDGVGVSALTVTADIFRAGSKIVTAAACIEISDGLYQYTLVDTSNNSPGEYIGLFKCSGDVDNAQLPAAWTVGAIEDSVDLTWDEQISEHTESGSFGEKVQLSTGSSGAAVNTVAAGYVLTTGVESNGDYEDTRALDSVEHQHTPTGDALELYYQFEIGGDGIPTGVSINGRINGSNDSLDGVYAYNWVTSGWDRVGAYEGTNATENKEDTFNLLVAHVGSGTDLGLVRIRFYSSGGLSSATLSIDRISVSYAIVSRSVGYDGGAVWIDTNGSNEGVEAYVDGTADNPVSTWAAALTIASDMGLSSFRIIGGSSITLTASSDYYAIIGAEYNLALGGQSIAGAYIEGATVTGIGSGNNARFVDCKIGDSSLVSCGMKHCAITANITLLSAGTYLFNGCFSGVAGTGSPSIDFGAAIGDTNLNMRHYSGGIEIKNMGGAGTDNMSLEGHGQLKINVSCVGGTVALRGHFHVTDSAAGAVSIVDEANFDKPILIPEQTADIGALETGDPRLDNLNATVSSRATQVSVDALPADGLSETDPRLDNLDATISSRATVDEVWEDNNLARTTPDSAGRVLKDTGSGVVAILDWLQNSGISIDPDDKQDIADLVLGTAVATVEDTADALSVAAIILGMYRATIDPISGKLIIRKSDGLQLFTEHNVVTTVDAEPITSVGLT